MTQKLFISYESRDYEIANAFSTMLLEFCKTCLPESKPLNPFVSYNAIRQGDWYHTLKIELEKSKALVCILTNRVTDSDWVKFEVGSAWISKDKTYILNLLDKKTIKNIPKPMENIQTQSSIYELVSDIITNHTNISLSKYGNLLRKYTNEFEIEIRKELKESNKVVDKLSENIKKATKWETEELPNLDYFYVILPEYIPFRSEEVRNAIKTNIQKNGTKYRYLLDNEERLKNLQKMITFLIEEEDDISLKARYINNIEYSILDASMVIQYFLHKTQLWFKISKRSKIKNPSYIVMLDGEENILTARHMDHYECNIVERSISEYEESKNFIYTKVIQEF